MISKRRIYNFYNYDLKITFLNKIKYGNYAPVYGERIWVRPNQKMYCKPILSHNDLFTRKFSGVVRGGDWDLGNRTIMEFKKIQSCFNHWVMNKPWNETEIFLISRKKILEQGEYDGIRSIQELIDRYNKLDQVYEAVKKDGAFLTRKELGLSKSNKEYGGPYFHISRYGEPIFAGAGWHRVAIALILNIGEMPAQIGVVHPEGIKFLKNFRK